MSLKGYIFNIQRFSIHDGPGIRTAVFFKGCNLSCMWCHNPESLSNYRQVAIHHEKCIGCGMCFKVCPNNAHSINTEGVHKIDRKLCSGCFTCAENCFSETLTGVGTVVDVEGAMRSILTDAPYFSKSKGGVTFSGGECMLQIDFLRALLAECCKHSIHAAIDTAGHVPWSYFERIMDYADLFLYDIKAADSSKHTELTGVGNDIIIENLNRLTKTDKEIIVRVPLIVGLNEQEMDGIANILADFSISKVELIPYHKLGIGKYAALDIYNGTADIEVPSAEAIADAINSFKKAGIQAEKAG